MTTVETAPQIPFFPPDLFEADRATLFALVREIGTAPEQKFILGGHTARMEQELAAWLAGSPGGADAEVVACSSGTSALTLILRAMNIGPGDEVVVPAFGCAPLAACVLGVGAVPAFADVHARTMVMDPADARLRIGPRTKALLPAHVFSVMADMPAFADLAARYGLRLIEDSAVAQGAVLGGRPAGLCGEVGLYSFVQVKSFGMPGEGGVAVTRDPHLASRIRLLRNHGQDGVHRFVHHEVGYNSRFDEIQAAFQRRRLPGLAARLERRAQIADYYAERFAPLAERGILAPPPGREGRCYYVYTLLADRRDELAGHLAARGVASHVYYPTPLPYQPAFRAVAAADVERFGCDPWPNASAASRRCLSIPVYPHLTDTQVEHVADAVCSFGRTT